MKRPAPERNTLHAQAQRIRLSACEHAQADACSRSLMNHAGYILDVPSIYQLSVDCH
jgi:hypothetical protein